ncbi:MAG TPA: biotin carboxylase N-terminal domain-containing protein [Mycobacteriales bacterium]|jgi:acetyl-CoA/propionyl-CoA carboxylase biotin carboxyl carrier protein|nr:biotin carboxylase N-terminal domain-containing protein [Mycobacteriales bacterium]
MFETVLIANRGEIAVRVVRTLRRLGIRSVAVYSDADAGALHVREADVAVRLGPAPARESYLSVERLLDAAAQTGAQAVHPGYGFLAESAAFARAVAEAGLVFVGPPPPAIDAMGDKIRAKQAVIAAGVPVVPGRTDLAMTDADLVDAAAEVGYPVLVKPSAGGGGKGMHLVADPADLPAALVSARRGAAASFGDDTLFLERYVLRPRHLEVQVLADNHGTTVHLGERECSLQRRHQKVIEEAPSPLLTPAQRERYGALAVATAEAVGYTGVGTVEFIVAGDAADEPFFMEMNTRLQVEHPVTELVTGLDLVEQQLRVAAGERLAFGQADVRLTGHAIEARVYAEDPSRGFLPTGGRALLLREPTGEGVRVDSSLLQGEPVGTTYDPMLSKVIASGPDRATALARLDRALAGTVLLGTTTNLGFLRALAAHPDVRAGRLDTGLLERSLDDTLKAAAAQDVPDAALVAAALHRRLALPDPADPWTALTGWRAGGPAPLRWDVLDASGARLVVQVVGDQVHVGDRVHRACARTAPDGLLLTLDGRTTTVLVAVDGATTWVALDGGTWAVVEAPPARVRQSEADTDAQVRSPMPGTVVAVHVSTGSAVVAGAALLAVEAMKMEHVLRAPLAGTVEVAVRVGDQVVVDQVVATVHAEQEP